MQKLLWFAICYVFFASLPDFGQNSSRDGWGPWRYTWQSSDGTWPSSPQNWYWSGIPFRSKCISSSGGDSTWAYQFRSRYVDGMGSGTMSFVEREEHGVDGATTNEFNQPEVFTLKGGALSPVFETHLHGTCEKFRELKHELKIQVLCVTDAHLYDGGDFPCFQDKNGTPLEFKRIPDHPEYQ
jgi:hypothetical protein